MTFRSLGSSSQGNCYLLEEGGSLLMIDCGFGIRELKSRGLDVKTANLLGVLVTHNHGDHIKGLESLRKACPDVPFFANQMTADASKLKCEFTIFENGSDFDVGPFSVHSFSTVHDVPDPVGFKVNNYFHCTDCGSILESIGRQFAEAEEATLESNHDLVLLNGSRRAPSVINRIKGPSGHLSNDQACEFVERFISPKLKKLNLAHLSQDCNAPHIARNAMRETLEELGRGDVVLEVLES